MHRKPQLDSHIGYTSTLKTNRSAYVAFRHTIPRGKFTLASRDLFFYRPFSRVVTDISVSVFIDSAPKILNRTLLNAKSKKCLTAEFVGYMSQFHREKLVSIKILLTQM